MLVKVVTSHAKGEELGGQAGVYRSEMVLCVYFSWLQSAQLEHCGLRWVHLMWDGGVGWVYTVSGVSIPAMYTLGSSAWHLTVWC